VTSIDKERFVSIIQFLQSVAEIDESSSSSMNESLNDYFETRVLAKNHEDAEQVSDAVLDELSDEFFCLKESFEV
jgi:ubiquitin C-terminal hydrolase